MERRRKLPMGGFLHRIGWATAASWKRLRRGLRGLILKQLRLSWVQSLLYCLVASLSWSLTRFQANPSKINCAFSGLAIFIKLSSVLIMVVFEEVSGKVVYCLILFLCERNFNQMVMLQMFLQILVAVDSSIQIILLRNLMKMDYSKLSSFQETFKG